MHSDFEPVIGLEVHAQLATDSKIFCGCKARLTEGHSVSEEEVNANCCEICSGHPGTLPVLNKKAVEFAIRAGLATHCTINPNSVFARKNYFYPDLPKGYQISQHDQPLCQKGYLEIVTEVAHNEMGNKTPVAKKVRIQRIHMEEDAGKNVHMSGFSLVNLNRAGVPLIEIVSEPDIKSADEASAYLKALHAIVTYLGICDGNMQEGNFRCDANVSVMPKGSKVLGTRAEIKNVNSFRFIEKAIEYEILRQIEVIKSGAKVVQETRGYDAAKGATFSMRSKEEAHDYRYFPDPDLIRLQVSPGWVESVRENLPELPRQKQERYVREYSLSEYDAGVLTHSKSMAEFFEQTIIFLKDKQKVPTEVAKPVANLLAGEISRLMNEALVEIHQTRIQPEHIADLVLLLQESTVSSTAAKKILSILWEAGGEVSTIVEREGLKQVSDLSALEPVIQKILDQNPSQVQEYKKGKEKLLGFFVGQAMKATQGKANPGLLQEMIQKKLK